MDHHHIHTPAATLDDDDDVEETATRSHTQNSAASSCSSRLSHLPTGGEDEEDPTTLIRVRAQQHPPVTYLMGPNSVRQNHTPADLGMEDGDAIDAMSHMLGGGAAVT
ncbi:hypothetical protein L3X38_035852 [Prunus dulcis]|uniref:Uncharacterized protein n=1 Tax=Prunus dulcis TaxID=3755 RepID=A0AAD4VKQ3_PRUDU|nr:hypothetical protein L3X38_035852 [Prunus dulcis]